MKIQKIFSEVNTGEKLYSVLLSGSEMEKIFAKPNPMLSKKWGEKNFSLLKRINVSWRRGNKINPYLLEKAEKLRKIPFPEDFKNIVLEYNNGRPIPNTFDTLENTKGHVIKKLLSFDKRDIETVYDSKKVLENDGFLKLFPIANDPSGNLICLNDKNEVVFWLHETGKLVLISKTFQEFINSLY